MIFPSPLGRRGGHLLVPLELDCPEAVRLAGRDGLRLRVLVVAINNILVRRGAWRHPPLIRALAVSRSAARIQPLTRLPARLTIVGTSVMRIRQEAQNGARNGSEEE
jgi:hypothetical protein